MNTKHIPYCLSETLKEREEDIISFTLSSNYITLTYIDGSMERVSFQKEEITVNRDFFWNRIQEKLSNLPHIWDNPYNRALAHICYEYTHKLESILWESFEIIPWGQGEILINRLGQGVLEYVAHAKDIPQYTPPKIVKK